MAVCKRDFSGNQLCWNTHSVYQTGPCVTFFLSMIQESLKWINFYDINDVKSNTKTALKAIPQTSSKAQLKSGPGIGLGIQLLNWLLWMELKWHLARRYVEILPTINGSLMEWINGTIRVCRLMAIRQLRHQLRSVINFNPLPHEKDCHSVYKTARALVALLLFYKYHFWLHCSILGLYSGLSGSYVL